MQGGLADGRPVLVTTTVTDAVPESATIRIVDAHTVFEAWLPAAGAARPALVVVTGPHGATRLPTLWETSHRAALRRARDILRGEGTGDDLTAFVSDAALVQRLLHTAEPTD